MNIDLLWRAEAVVTFDYGWSKNRMWLPTRTHKRRLSPAARAHRQALARALAADLGDRRVRHNRLWLGINAQKPDHRGDSLNVLDLVSDAVEDATGLNDRWYQIAGLTWGIDKENPRLIVWIGQEDLPDAQICGRCGMLLPFADFHRNRSTPTKRSGVCRRCSSLARTQRLERRRELYELDGPPASSPDPSDPPPW